MFVPPVSILPLFTHQEKAPKIKSKKCVLAEVFINYLDSIGKDEDKSCCNESTDEFLQVITIYKELASN